jgi:ABC-2 type transport system ATP-binding protein
MIHEKLSEEGGEMETVYTKDLGKRYSNGVWGARKIDLVARSGEVTVLLGPNGAGKTTTIKMLATLTKPTKGEGYVLGYDIYREANKIRRHIALMPQEGSVPGVWTPYEAVKWYLVARGFSIGDASREAKKWLEELGLWDLRNRSAYELSGGQRKRVLAAMIIATGADVMFLDEAGTGLDIESKYRLWSAIRRIARENRCVIYTSHEMREIENIASKIVFINNGETVASGTPQELAQRYQYKYKILIKGEIQNKKELNGENVLITGEFTRILLRDRGEIHEYIDKLRDLRDVEIREIDLEDIYLLILNEVRRNA